MKENLAKAALTLALAGAAAWFRELAGPLCALALVMLSDYITGVMEAYRSGTLDSRTGVLGILKKVAYLFAVGVAAAVDYVLRTSASRLGLTPGQAHMFTLLVTVWLILNECLSILENIARLGVPVPGFLKAVTARLKQSAEAEGASCAGEDGAEADRRPAQDDGEE